MGSIPNNSYSPFDSGAGITHYLEDEKSRGVVEFTWHIKRWMTNKKPYDMPSYWCFPSLTVDGCFGFNLELMAQTALQQISCLGAQWTVEDREIMRTHSKEGRKTTIWVAAQCTNKFLPDNEHEFVASPKQVPSGPCCCATCPTGVTKRRTMPIPK